MTTEMIIKIGDKLEYDMLENESDYALKVKQFKKKYNVDFLSEAIMNDNDAHEIMMLETRRDYARKLFEDFMKEEW